MKEPPAARRPERAGPQGTRVIHPPPNREAPAAPAAIEQERFTIRSDNIVIGRKRECDVVIDADSVSLMHASIYRKEGAWWIQSYLASNGVFVNESKVKNAPLKHGDRLRFGEVVMVFNQPTRSGRPELHRVAAVARDQATPSSAAGQRTRVISRGDMSTFIEETWEEIESGAADEPESAVDRVSLLGRAGAARGQRIALTGSQSVIGRKRDCDVVVDSDSVSLMHASVFFRDGRWRVQNYISSNGTFVNGRRVKDATLADGDVIRLGDVEFEFREPTRRRGIVRRLLGRMAAMLRLDR